MLQRANYCNFTTKVETKNSRVKRDVYSAEITFDGIVDLLDEQLQLHHQGGCVRVRLPRCLLLHHFKGTVDPVFNVKIIVQEFGEIHLTRSLIYQRQKLVCSEKRLNRLTPLAVIDPSPMVASSSQATASKRI